MQKLLSSLLLLALLPPLALGQAQSQIQTSLRECSAISDNSIRVACYDALARQQGLPGSETVIAAPAAEPAPAPVVVRPTQDVAVPAPAATPATQPAPPRTQADQNVTSFGQQARVESNPEGENVLVDTVTNVRQVEPTKVQITLESGQVWRQTIGKTFLIRKGDSVRISGTNWGSDYRMTVAGRPGFIQVSRVQ
jgi:hypothetical protein